MKPSFRANLKNISELYPNTWRKAGKTTTRTNKKAAIACKWLSIEADVTSKEVIDALKENGVSANTSVTSSTRKKSRNHSSG